MTSRRERNKAIIWLIKDCLNAGRSEEDISKLVQHVFPNVRWTPHFWGWIFAAAYRELAFEKTKNKKHD